MRVKRLLIGLLVSGLAFSFTGCGDEVINDNGENVQSFGQFVEIKSSGNYAFRQYFVYDKNTKIVYVLQAARNFSGITPYYILDENGKPEIAIYGENYNG